MTGDAGGVEIHVGMAAGESGATGWRQVPISGRGAGRVLVRGVLFSGEPGLGAVLDALSPGDPASAAAAPPDVGALAQALAALDGHFALIARIGTRTLAVVDRVRSYPLIQGTDGGHRWILSDRGDRVETCLDLGPGAVDPDAALAVGLAGYTIGNSTLYGAVRQVGAGTASLWDGGRGPETVRYHRYAPWRVLDLGTDHAARDAAAAVTLTILRKAADSIGDRPVLVPLSAGRDSRLIASGLQAVGVKDIRCFAYGLPGNHEAETSRRIAERLGLSWTFVPFGNRMMRAVQTSADYRGFIAASDSLTGIHFPQDLAALRALERQRLLPRDAVIINGQSGDFITGNHVPDSLITPDRPATPGARQDAVLDAVLTKHFRQWRLLATPAALQRLRTRLAEEIAAIGGIGDDPATDHGLFEWLEFQDRQSKYVVNGQRAYDHLGYDWRLPLWDTAYLDFWAGVPPRHKQRQRLYADMLVATNWGGVWRDVPVNARTIRPRWMIPVRAACKLAHAPYLATGTARARWHRFERQVIDYWTGNLCAAAFVPYGRVLRDRRGAWSAIAWHIEAYLAGKGIALEDLRRDWDSVR